ncbi:MAG: diacylglycerol kinase family protein [Patescibacteria group bacterium]|nr:diacylglycerol kinase family protein [Patescibacteria group bacterium]
MAKQNRLLKSFGFALIGLAKVFKEEKNFQIHTAVTLIVLFFAFYFQIAIWQWVVLILIIALVMVLEIINSIFERLLDLIKPRLHEYVGDIKDMTAAAVLVGAVSAAIIGLIIFIPYIVAKFFS